MDVSELEGVDQPQGLVDVASHGQVIDSDLAQDSRWRNNEESTEEKTFCK